MDSWEESHRYWGCKAASLSQVLRYTPPLWLKRVTELLQFHVLNRQGLPHCTGAPGRQETKATKHGNPRPLGLTVWWCTCACTHAHTCARIHVCTRVHAHTQYPKKCTGVYVSVAYTRWPHLMIFQLYDRQATLLLIVTTVLNILPDL